MPVGQAEPVTRILCSIATIQLPDLTMKTIQLPDLTMKGVLGCST